MITVKFTIEDFINKSNLVHKNKYNYSLVEYLNIFIPVKIICPIHGKFNQYLIRILVVLGVYNVLMNLKEVKVNF